MIPRIAIFAPNEEISNVLFALFAKHEYSIRTVASVAEALDLVQEETQNFDLFTIPLLLADGTSASNVCIHAKSEELFATVPIICLSTSLEKALVKSLYGVGADLVLHLPIDPDFFNFHVMALCRSARNYREQIDKSVHESGLLHPVIQAFHGVREGFLLFSSKKRLLFRNRSAEILLGFGHVEDEQAAMKIESQFKSLIAEHDAGVRLMGENAQDSEPSTVEVTLQRLDHQTFRTSVTISSVYRNGQDLLGYTVALTNQAELVQLSNRLVQAQKGRSLCLTMAAAALHFLEREEGHTIISPLKLITDRVAQAERHAIVASTVTYVLEVVDLLISPNLSIRVGVTDSLHVAVSKADLFMVLGYIILHSIDFCSEHGEILITNQNEENQPGVSILITAKSHVASFYDHEDSISRLIQSDFSSVETGLQESTDNVGIHAAQKIAEENRTTIEYQRPDNNTIRFRVRFPRSAPPIEK